MDSKIIKILEEKIIEIQEKSADFKEKKTIYEAYKSVVSSFKTNNYDELITATHAMPYILDEIVPIDESISVEKEMLEAIMMVKKMDSRSYQDIYDARRSSDKFNLYVLTFEKKKLELERELSREKDEIYKLWDLEKKCRLLIKKINFKAYIAPLEIVLIHELLKGKNVSYEEEKKILEEIKVNNEQYRIPSPNPAKSVCKNLKTEFKMIHISEEERERYAYLNGTIHDIYISLELTPDASYVYKYIETLNDMFVSPQELSYVVRMLINMYISYIYEDIDEMSEFLDDEEFTKIIMDSYRSHTKVYYPLEKYYKEKFLGKQLIRVKGD